MVNIALLWHMHQPWYVSPFSRRIELPWVRVHAVRDYYGMARLVSEFPGIRVTFNLVPSLLKQIGLYLVGRKDSYQEIFAVPGGELSREQSYFLVNHFFSVNYENHIRPFQRYDFLLNKMKDAGGKVFSGDWREVFSAAELTDIQAWFSLTNIDQYYREEDERIIGLMKKGGSFSEEDKDLLQTVEYEIMGKIIPLYRELWESGNIEVSTTPFYHPILPLLIDPQLGRTADPGLPEYDLRFNWRDDAETQMDRGLDYMENLFGRRPQGVWPSEGSLSEDVLDILGSRGIKWTATDEKVLFNSLRLTGTDPGEAPFSKYAQWKNGDMKIFFRDNQLSDLIGFHYKDRDPLNAAEDLYHRIVHYGEKSVSIILDGENAWEFYSGSGRKFLREFYSMVNKRKETAMVTFSDASKNPARSLTRFAPGSWINGDFNIWIGDEDDRRAWGLIRTVKELLEEKKDLLSEEEKKSAAENILIAEGSDWFWWYGTENYTEDIETFDRLFRENLIKACLTAKIGVPAGLEIPVFTTGTVRKAPGAEPERYLSPVIDGKITSIYEWQGSGEIEPGNLAAAIYVSHPFVKKIHYGFDKENLYLKIELHNVDQTFFHEGEFQIEIEKDGQLFVLSTTKGETIPEWAFQELLECRIPFPLFNGEEGSDIEFCLVMTDSEKRVSTFPGSGRMTIRIPSERDYAARWTL